MRSVTRPSAGPSEPRPRWQRWGSRLGLALALAAGLAYLPYRLLDGPGLRQAPQLERDLARTRQAIGALRVENTRIRREIDALKNESAAIEDFARAELGMVRPGDIVICVDRSAGASGLRGREGEM